MCELVDELPQLLEPVALDQLSEAGPGNGHIVGAPIKALAVEQRFAKLALEAISHDRAAEFSRHRHTEAAL